MNQRRRSPIYKNNSPRFFQQGGRRERYNREQGLLGGYQRTSHLRIGIHRRGAKETARFRQDRRDRACHRHCLQDGQGRYRQGDRGVEDVRLLREETIRRGQTAGQGAKGPRGRQRHQGRDGHAGAGDRATESRPRPEGEGRRAGAPTAKDQPHERGLRQGTGSNHLKL